MRLAMLARGDRRGLAIQCTEFARHMRPERVLGIDMEDLSPYPCCWDDYDPDTLTVVKLSELTEQFFSTWISGAEVCWTAETFYRDWAVSAARASGVRTVVHANAEFARHIYDWGAPDLVVVPTTWRIDTLPGAIHLPLGVDRRRLPFRLRTEARHFLHVIGHTALHDRAGTSVLWDALMAVQESMTITVRAQRHVEPPRRVGSHIDLRVIIDDVANYWDLYAEGDVLVLPRRYGGQALALSEALSCGMPVLMSDTAPQNGTLPPGMLVGGHGGRQFRSQVGPIGLFDTSPELLAQRMDALARDPGEVEILSKQADQLAGDLDWAVMAPRWRGLLQSLL